ncbi:hypothetical protein VTL71DRAFT_6190 [Oculimacula yallundae]|uniref:DUF7605 domain-containing protein n=1 Tax=Oculimacula yallundae TaxID=86028 RepID=A0ABR4BZN9_9HELO
MGIDEQTRLEAKSKLAWDTLYAAFGSKPELTENYLRDTSDGAEARIQRKLQDWTATLEWPGDSHESGWLGTAETVSECKDQTRRFLSGNLWPFIKVIRIYLSSQVLRTGGFHDSNNARVAAAETYMNKCDEIFVVADINRVSTNRNVETIFQKALGSNLANGRPSQGVSLICTKSEDFDVDEIIDKFYSDRRLPDTRKVARLREKLDEIESEPERPGALQRRDECQNELNYIFMTARNDYIKSLVQRNHAALFQGRHLSVFCVSNKSYQHYRRRHGAHDLPVKGSGIPALRRHCHTIPAQAQFRIAHHFLTVSMKGLVQQVQLWLAGGSQETMPNDATVQRLLGTIQNELEQTTSESVAAALDSQKSIGKECLIQPMTTNLGIWTQSALTASMRWRALHHTQYRAFLRHYGDYGGTARCAPGNWNLELIESMVNDLSLCWDDIDNRLATSMDTLENLVTNSLEALLDQVENFNGAPLFANALRTMINATRYAFIESKERLETLLESIKRNATSNHHSAYIYKAMDPVYRACISDYGTGVTARSYDRIREAIGSIRSPVLFEAIRSQIRRELREVIKENLIELRRDIDEILAEIGDDIEMLRGSEARVLARNGDFLERLEIVLRSVTVEMDNIQLMADRIQNTATGTL